jgi:MoxR-like ATPase
MRASQALALLRGREYVLPDDVKALAVHVLSHRLILREEKRLQGETQESLVLEMVAQAPVPTPAG